MKLTVCILCVYNKAHSWGLRTQVPANPQPPVAWTGMGEHRMR